MKKGDKTIVRIIVLLQIMLVCLGTLYLWAGYNILGSSIILLSVMGMIVNIKTLNR